MGTQLDVREVAGYLAKYATKHTECVGGLDRRLKVEDLDVLPVPEHVHRLAVTAWLLALHDPRLRSDRWAHQFGYGGHFLTKFRHYSTTFTRLRTAAGAVGGVAVGHRPVRSVGVDAPDRQTSAAQTVGGRRVRLAAGR